MNDFKRVAEAEIEMLTLELEKLHSRERVIELKLAALKAYLNAEEASPVSRQRGALPSGIRFHVTPATPAKKSVKDQVVEAATRILTDGVPRTTDVLVEMLLAEGIAIGGTNKATAVSSILSRDDSFKASRKDGWSLDKKESLGANEAFDLQPTP